MRYFVASLFLMFTLSIHPAYALEKAEVEKIVADYLKAHPEAVVDSLRRYQEREEMRQRKSAKAAALEHKDILFNPNDPSVGPANAPVVMAEFFDYNCSACKYMYQALADYYQANGTKDLRVIFKEYPIFGERSIPAAKAALAVHRLYPDKYFKFHSALMSHEGAVNQAVVFSVLDSLGLDKEKVLREAASPEVTAELEKNLQLAQSLGAEGTPLLVIGDEVIGHALDLEALKGYVENAKAKQ